MQMERLKNLTGACRDNHEDRHSTPPPRVGEGNLALALHGDGTGHHGFLHFKTQRSLSPLYFSAQTVFLCFINTNCCYQKVTVYEDK